jgi:predicted TIM-barrel fold metal-dependent hydrolase
MSYEPEANPDLDILIRTGITDPIAIGLAETLLEEAEIPFFAMDRNTAARQESGNFLGWWNVRVPRDREAEARELLRAVEEAK